ncbi:MAG: YraN family protein [Pseudomonadales bacterium]|nr:YraN family protein [Pseudomonadales bacterium]
MNSRQTGNRAEQSALNYLESHGLRLLDRNFSCRMGEIDLVMDDQGTLVFVEVRYRSDPGRGSGAESITRSKIRKLTRTAEFYLMTHPERGSGDCRFDVVSMDQSVDWIRNAFTLDD